MTASITSEVISALITIGIVACLRTAITKLPMMIGRTKSLMKIHALRIAIGFDLAVMCAISGFAAYRFHGTEAATQGDLLSLYGLCFVLVLAATCLLYDFVAYQLEKALRRRS